MTIQLFCTWYLRVIPLKIADGILRHIFSSKSTSSSFFLLVCPNPLPNEHSPMLVTMLKIILVSNEEGSTVNTNMSNARLWKSSIRSVTTGPLSSEDKGGVTSSVYRLMSSPMHWENKNSRLSTYPIVNAGDRNFFNLLWGSGRLWQIQTIH